MQRSDETDWIPRLKARGPADSESRGALRSLRLNRRVLCRRSSPLLASNAGTNWSSFRRGLNQLRCIPCIGHFEAAARCAYDGNRHAACGGQTRPRPRFRLVGRAIKNFLPQQRRVNSTSSFGLASTTPQRPKPPEANTGTMLEGMVEYRSFSQGLG